MRPDALADLDTLVLVCRDLRSRAYISEAVGSYRANAFRAAIVTTWVAVVFDFIHKLGELEMTGDKRAKTILDEFRKCQAAADVKASWEFERNVLDRALELELITRHEHEDLTRLLADRNRCAHPALNTGDEAYSPSAELARLHIRNAVLHLLQHQPVQGLAAMERLKLEVLSDYFPTKIEDAVEHFRRGPLQRPREALVRNFAVANLKHLLGPDLAVAAAPRFIAALGALREMHRDVVEAVMRERLTVLARSAIADGRWRAVLRLLKRLADVWPYLEEDVRSNLSRYVDALPAAALPIELPMALDCNELRSNALDRITKLTEQELADIIAKSQRREFVDRALEFYSDSGSFDKANTRAKTLIIPLTAVMSAKHVKRTIEACGNNGEIKHSFQCKKVIDALRQRKLLPDQDFETLLVENGLSDKSEEN